jgi:hypothetical protein
VVVFSADYYIVAVDSMTVKFNFSTESAVFQKPDDSVNHLKPLHVKGHINGTPVHSMLVDGGAIVNLIPYPLYKKFSGTDEELIKTNMTISGVGGGAPIPGRGVAIMELTIGSKTLATTFFVADVQGSYNLILGRDWIHANRCVPSSLHQFLIQWVGDVLRLCIQIHWLMLLQPMLLHSGGMMLLLGCLAEIFLALSLLVLPGKVLFMYL